MSAIPVAHDDESHAKALFGGTNVGALQQLLTNNLGAWLARIVVGDPIEGDCEVYRVLANLLARYSTRFAEMLRLGAL